MAEELGKLKVALNFDGQEMIDSLDALQRQLKTAQAAFKASSAGVDKYHASLEQLREQSTRLENVLRLQEQQAQRLRQAWQEEVAQSGRNSEASQRLEQAYLRSVATMRRTELQYTQLNERIQNYGHEQQQAGRATEQATKTMGDSESKLASLKEAFKSVGGIIAGAFAVDKIVDFGKTMIETTANIDAMQSQYEQVVGGMKAQTDKYLDQMATKWNKHPNELKNAFMQYYAILKSKGVAEGDAYKLSQSYLERTVDANAFANEDMGSTTERFMGMIKGEYDSVDTAMVNMNQTMLDTKAQQVYKKKFQDLTVTQQETLKTQIALQQHTSSGVFGQGVREADSYQNNLAMVKDTWNQLMHDFGSPLLELANEGLKKLKDIVAKVDIQKVEADFKKVASYIGTVFKPIIDVLIKKFNEIKTAIAKAFGEDSGAKGMNKLKEALNWFIKNLPKITKGIADFIDKYDYLIAGIAGGIAAFKAIATAIQIWKGITTIAIGVQAAFNAVMDANPIGIVVLIIGALIAVGILLYKNWDKISKFFSDFWKKLKQGFQDLLIAVGKWVMDMYNKFEELKLKVEMTIALWIVGMVGKIVGFITNILTKITSFKNSMVSYFQSLGSSILSHIQSAFSGMVNAISSKVSSIISKVTEIKNNIINTIKGINLLEIGKNIIEGLINGIVGKAEALYNKAKEIANKIKNFFTSALQIKSPSRVMRDEVGKWIPLGIAQGMEQNIDSIQKAAQKLAIASMPNINAAALNGISTVNNTTNFAPNIIVNSNDPFKAAMENKRMLKRLAFEGGLRK